MSEQDKCAQCGRDSAWHDDALRPMASICHPFLSEKPKCFKCGHYMNLIEATNGLFWACDGPHRDGQWQAFRAAEDD